MGINLNFKLAMRRARWETRERLDLQQDAVEQAERERRVPPRGRDRRR